jgi:GGDEF domain-containing protein
LSERAHEESVAHAAPEPASSGGLITAARAPSLVGSLLELQATAGNRAVVQVIRRFTGPVTESKGKVAAETGARSRLEAFVALARASGISREAAVELFDIAGGRQIDPMSGFGSGGDRSATATLAAEHATKTHTPTFQVDADLTNLGGLNAELGHSGSDRVYGQIAAIVVRWLQSTGYQVEPFRSGGELAYIVVARGAESEDVARERVWGAMREADKQVKGFVANMRLSNVANPRGGSPGIGINVDVITAATAAARKAEARSKVSPLPPLASNAVTSFTSASQQRRERFVAVTEAEGVERDTAERLWQAAGSGNADALTGFDAAGDRVPSLEGAVKFVANGGAACYVEVDIRNVGGMNRVSKGLGDEVVRDIAGAARAAAASVGGDVTSIRHGGDEVSFIVTANGTSQALKDALVTALAAARVRVSAEMAHLEWVPHPKRRGESGTGLFFGVSAISETSDPEQVFHEADSAVEAMKTAGPEGGPVSG